MEQTNLALQHLRMLTVAIPSGIHGNGVSAKDLKSLSKCQSDAAKDPDLTRAKYNCCFSKQSIIYIRLVFNLKTFMFYIFVQ
jgi:hypothetical protein